MDKRFEVLVVVVDSTAGAPLTTLTGLEYALLLDEFDILEAAQRYALKVHGLTQIVPGLQQVN